MNSNKERYKICLQCCEERNNILRCGNFNWEITSLEERVQKPYLKWINVTELAFSVRYDTHRLCRDCEYVLEHVVLGGQVFEQER